MITEHRKQYIIKWKKDNKNHIRDYWRRWYGTKVFTNEVDGTGFYGKSGLGRKYEIIAKTLLKGSTPSPNFKYPYDIEWNGMKIDVKMRNKNKRGTFHFTTRPTCTADFYLCFCVDTYIRYILLIPSFIYKNCLDLNDRNINKKYKKYIFEIKEQ